MHCSVGVKPECHLSAATAAKMTHFTDIPKSALHVQLPDFRTLCAALASRVSSIWVRSFVTKVALLKLILWQWDACNYVTPLHQMCGKFSAEQKKCAPVLYTNFKF